MLRTGNTVIGKSCDIYLDGAFKDKARSGFSGNNVWYFDVLEENSIGYKIRITKSASGQLASGVFNPTVVWVKKGYVSVSINVQTKPPLNVGDGVVLRTGDKMVVTNANGKELGVFTFKES